MNAATPSSMTPQLGFIGLGTLGSAIAEKLMSEKIPLAVWNRSPEKMTRLVAKGAISSKTIDQLCQQSEWVLSCVSDDAAMQQINKALTQTNSPPTVHLSFSSCTPNAVQFAAEQARNHNIVFINCPVLGRPDVVTKGMATYLVAGDQKITELAAPLFAALGGNYRYLSAHPERAATIKLAMNYFIALTIGGLTEIASTLEQQQLSMDAFLDVLANSPAGSALNGLFGSLIADQKFKPPLFDLRLAQKDIGYFTNLASDSSDLFLATGLTQHMTITQGEADEAIDWSGLASHLLTNP